MQVKYSDIGDEPISVAEAKSYMRVAISDDDTFIGNVITQARELIEEITNRSLVVKTVQVFYPDPDLTITLPFPEHDEITAVSLDGTDVLSDIYTTGLTQKIITIPSMSSSISADSSGLFVTYTTTGEVPSGLKDVIYKVIQEMYDNRGNTSYDVKEDNTYDVLMLVQPYIL